MKYAQVQVLPPIPPGGVTAGIDWATADHAACVVDEAGKVRSRFSAVHDRDGIRKLVGGLRAAGAAEVAIERGEGILVDALLAAGLTVVVITSRQVKNLRSRYGSAGAKDDRFDAFVLADVLRTDRARLRPLVPDSPATLAPRAAVRARRDLVAHRIAACNQLRAHLNASFPAGTGITDGTTPMASIDWEAALTALHTGRLPASSGERSILQLAASIAAGTPVSLRDTVTSLDNANLGLLVIAVRHAAGHRPR